MCMYKDKEDGHCMLRSCAAVTEYCHDGPCDDEVLTNADRIRTMTDEELVKFHHSNEYCKVEDPIDCDMHDFVNGLSPCEQCYLKWLQQPAEEYGS